MYLIFGGECYYASGGANDLLDKDIDKDTAIEKAKSFLGKNAVTYIVPEEDLEWDDEQCHPIEWVHVFDINNNKVVYESDNKPLGGHKVLKIRG